MSRLPLRALALVATVSLLAACGGDSITGPQRNARQMAARFDVVAESLFLAGQPDAADGATLLAEVLRTTDRLYAVAASVDGEARTYNALLLQVQLPEQQCFPGEVCEPLPEFMQVVVGWRGEDVTDGFAFLMGRTGTIGVPSPFLDGPVGDPLDGSAPIEALGGLFERAGERAWLASSGNVTTQSARPVDGCRESGLFFVAPTEVECRVGTVTFRADVGLHETNEEGGILLPESRRTLRIVDQTVAGLALTIAEIPDQMRSRISPRRLLPMFR